MTAVALPAHSIPLLVGITGHHELEPGDATAQFAAVRALLDEIARSAPHTPLVVLSTPAPGAGLLGAEVAVDAGLALIACLPAPREEYESTLSADDRVRFRAVMQHASSTVVVPHDLSDAGGRSATGWYLAFHSHVLIALWDGNPTRSPGSTADVIRLRETGLSSLRWATDPAQQREPDPMPMFTVVARRRDAALPPDAGAVVRRYPRRFSGDTKAQKTFDTSIERLDRYNADLAATPRGPTAAGGLAELMDLTDRTANRLQRRALYQLRALYGLSLVAIAAQLGFADRFNPEPIKIATLIAAFVAYRIARSANLENRYQDYRAVAEGLRVQRAWNALGGRIEYVDPCYMRMQQSELQWIRLALRSAEVMASLSPQAPNERAAVGWVREQWRYYHRAAVRDSTAGKRYGKLGKFSQWVGIATMGIAALLLLPPFQALPAWLTLGAKHGSTSFAALLGAAAALFGSYADKRGYSANAKRYDRMFGVFDRAMRQLHRVDRGAAGDRAQIVHDVGREALVEQAEWLLARRDRPLRVVGR